MSFTNFHTIEKESEVVTCNDAVISSNGVILFSAHRSQQHKAYLNKFLLPLG